MCNFFHYIYKDELKKKILEYQSHCLLSKCLYKKAICACTEKN